MGLIPFSARIILADKGPGNAGKRIGGDDVQLKPGDVITIFSQSDLQVADRPARQVHPSEGEFHTAGAYLVESGESLRHVITKIAGFTPQADLYGGDLRTKVSQRRPATAVGRICE